MSQEWWWGYGCGILVGLVIGALLWRIHAIMWRNEVGYMGRKNHR